MAALPIELYRVAEVREIEHAAIEKHGIDAATLMKRAGEFAYDVLLESFDQAVSIAIVCGKGNNGGDGFVLATLLNQDDFEVIVYSLCDIEELPTVAKQAAKACKKQGIEISRFSPEADFEVDLIVDAILGIGLQGPAKDEALQAIQAVNKSDSEVLALDTPSGLDVDKGCVPGEAIFATATATFLGVKPGLMTGAGKAHAGDLYFTDLKVPEEIYEDIKESAYRLDKEDIKEALGLRLLDVHKGDFGHVLIVGGDYGMSGAVRMAAEAALRAGAGLVSVVTRSEHVSAIVASRPEIMCCGMNSAEDLQPLLEKATVIVIGPGLGNSSWSQEMFNKVLSTDLPLLVDASALTLLAKQSTQRNNWILTPHPGEAARLLESETKTIQNDRFQAVQQLQQRYGGVCVLKGAGTLVQVADENPDVCYAGNPGMATAGMGDVLSGIIGGLMAQDLSLEKAARVGVMLHALAGDLAAEEGERGMLATDLMPHIRSLVNPEQGEEELIDGDGNVLEDLDLKAFFDRKGLHLVK